MTADVKDGFMTTVRLDADALPVERPTLKKTVIPCLGTRMDEPYPENLRCDEFAYVPVVAGLPSTSAIP